MEERNLLAWWGAQISWLFPFELAADAAYEYDRAAEELGTQKQRNFANRDEYLEARWMEEEALLVKKRAAVFEEKKQRLLVLKEGGSAADASRVEIESLVDWMNRKELISMLTSMSIQRYGMRNASRSDMQVWLKNHYKDH